MYNVLLPPVTGLQSHTDKSRALSYDSSHKISHLGASKTFVVDVEDALPMGFPPASERHPSLLSFSVASAAASSRGTTPGLSGSGTGIAAAGTAEASPARGSTSESLKEPPSRDGVPLLLLSHQLPALQHQTLMSPFDIVADAQGRLLQVGHSRPSTLLLLAG